MAHCPPEMLADLVAVLAEVRGWAGVREDKPGVFYVRRQPFLHFHLMKGGTRRGDIKGSRGWISLDLPRPISATRRQALRRELLGQYREVCEA
ncbi:MAG TPA: hypothetical protein VFE97_05935 [Methylomirabilota bacterium]|nr:hypothetical protein [Methylomirabilota bacterium]